jgi:hypothetical protein
VQAIVFTLAHPVVGKGVAELERLGHGSLQDPATSEQILDLTDVAAERSAQQAVEKATSLGFAQRRAGLALPDQRQVIHKLEFQDLAEVDGEPEIRVDLALLPVSPI